MMTALASMLIRLRSSFAISTVHIFVSQMTEAEDHGTRGTVTDDAAVCIDNREDGIDFPTSAEDDGMDGMDGMDETRHDATGKLLFRAWSYELVRGS